MFDPTDQKLQLNVNRNPIQRPGCDRCLRSATFGGPTTGRDVRMFLDKKTLTQLLDICNSSTTGRVVINKAGLQVSVYEGGDGNRYETWAIIGESPRPESSVLG